MPMEGTMWRDFPLYACDLITGQGKLGLTRCRSRRGEVRPRWGDWIRNCIWCWCKRTQNASTLELWSKLSSDCEILSSSIGMDLGDCRTEVFKILHSTLASLSVRVSSFFSEQSGIIPRPEMPISDPFLLDFPTLLLHGSDDLPCCWSIPRIWIEHSRDYVWWMGRLCSKMICLLSLYSCY